MEYKHLCFCFCSCRSLEDAGDMRPGLDGLVAFACWALKKIVNEHNLRFCHQNEIELCKQISPTISCSATTFPDCRYDDWTGGKQGPQHVLINPKAEQQTL